MKTSLPAFLLLTLAFLSFPIDATAIDCKIAKLPVELKICADLSLKVADDELGQAYQAALSRISDPALRKALIGSQRSWVRMRALGLGEFRMDGGAGAFDEQAALLQITKDRTDFLLSDTPSNNLNIEHDHNDQFTGGKFAGVRADCFFVPPFFANWDYQCLSTISRQRGSRIVAKDVEWTSGRETETRYKGVLVNGIPKFEFFCQSGAYPVKPCYANDDEEEAGQKIQWYPLIGTEPKFDRPNLTGISQYDADVNLFAEDIDWMDVALAVDGN